MSSTIDQRVVEMRFDNKHFENNVKTSISTLDRLKQKLNLSDSAKSFDSINDASRRINFNGLTGALDTVHTKFSALQVMGVTALANITNSAVNAGKRIAASFTVDPIKTGLEEYETQINAVQTILANTQSKGSTLKDVNSALDELNKYADMTIYNFTEMTRNIGTFTAAGVDLDKSVTSIKGIANLAAVSGSTSQQASTAMYQLSQALASGKVSLMDWNSVVNAGMGGELFQNALKRTAKNMGKNVDAMIKKYGSFRESLTKGEWLTADVLTETLTQLSGAYTEKELLAKGYTKKQAKEITELAKTATDAATKVKTFTQLMDTLKEAAQSGWTQTWEIIIGDFEEAKALWTSVSDVFSGIINSSAEARNKMLQGWADGGGRTMAIEALKNAFEGLVSIIKPINEAFREIFPRTTSEQLLKITKTIRDLTAKFKLNESQAAKLKSTFKGLFSIVDIGLTFLKELAGGIISIIGNFTGLGDGILNVTGKLGDNISSFRDYIKETDVFGTAIGKVTDFISNVITKIKEFGKSLRESFSTSDYSGFVGYLKAVWELITQVGSSVVKAFSSISGGIAEALGGSNIFEVLNNGLFAGILFYIGKFIKGLKDTFDSAGGVLENITGILDDVRGCFQAYQEQLKAGALLKIAMAVGLLAAAILVISTIDGNKLAKALGAITVLFVELMASLFVFSKISDDLKGATKGAIAMIGIAIAITILAGALKKISSIDQEGIVKGLLAIGVLMAELSLFLNTAKFGGKMISTSVGIVILSSAMIILAQAVKSFGIMDWTAIGKGLAAIGSLLLELAIFSKLTSNAKHVISTGLAMVLLGASMKIFASAVNDFGGMDLNTIGRGLLAMSGALLAVSIAMKLIPKSTVLIGTGLVVVASSLKILASALSDFGGMSWTEIGKGLVVLGASLIELAIGLKLMSGSLSGSAALLIAASALAVLVPVIKSFGEMSWSEIGKGLITLAGAFTVIGVAGLLLTPLVPTLLGLAGAFVLFGVATLGIGAGLALIGAGLMAVSAGLTTFAGSVAASATGIVAGLSVIIMGLLGLVPAIAKALAEGVVEFAKAIGESASEIAESLLKMIAEVLTSLAKYSPIIIDQLLTFLIGLIDGLADHLPELIVSVMNFIGKLFEGIVQALNGIDMKNLLNGIMAVGLLSGLMYALSAVVGVIPGAMLGVLGIGAVIAELALVLAAIGALAQIDGLSFLVEEGGKFLEKVGTAIGQFIGGIVGGVMQGISSSLPQIGTDLSTFMTNFKPFLEGVKTIDSSALSGVVTLCEMLLLLTATDILNGLASFITGGSSLSNFAEQLIPFGEAMKEYADSISGIDNAAVTGSATAAKSLSELAANLPNSGGLVSLITGDNELGDFAEQLIPFGKAMKNYSKSISGIDTNAVQSSAVAAKSLSELAANLPNTGGLVSLFTGDNDLGSFGDKLIPFGKGMKAYSDSIKGIDTEAVTNSATAAKVLSELANSLPNTGGLVSLFTGDNDLGSFGKKLVPFGEGMKEYADSIEGIDTSAITNSATAAKTLSELASELPNSGGLVSLFTGDNDLGSFGYKLIPFGEGMKAYGESISGMDVMAITNSATAAKTLAELAKTLPNTGGLVSLFTGNNDLSTFGFKLIPFGEGMKEYSNSIKGIDSEAIVNSSTAAKTLSELANNLPNTGGISSWFTGESDLASFGDKLIPFGKGMKAYGKSISGMDSEAVANSATAAGALSELAKNLPETGGLVSLFTGSSDLELFGTKLAPFGKGMKEYAKSIKGIDPEAIVNSTTAAKSLSELAANLPNSGGIGEWFSGNNDIDVFGDKLPSFGEGMREYAKSIKGIDTEAVTNSTTAAKSLAELAKNLPETGGMGSWFTGESDLGSFGKKLVPFGEGMKEYSKSVTGIDGESMQAAAKAAKSLSDLASNLPDEGGLFKLFSSEEGLASFSQKLVPFGKGMKEYSLAVQGMDNKTVTSSTVAAKALVEVANSLTNSGGLESLLSGSKDIGAFGNKLVPFGKGMKKYSETVTGIDTESIIKSAKAAKALSDVANSIPNSGGLVTIFSGDNDLATFASKLVPFGKGINDYSKSVSGLNVEAIKKSTTTIKSLVSVIKNLSGINQNGVNSFVAAINTLGKASVDKFVSAFNGYSAKLKTVGSGMVDSLTKGIDSSKAKLHLTITNLIGLLVKSIDSNKLSLNKVGASLMLQLIKTIDATKIQFKASSIKLMNDFISGINSKKAQVAEALNVTLRNVNTKARGYYHEFYNTGKYLVSGFASGISANTYMVKAKASAMASAAAQAARKALDIHSPSRVLYAIGDFAGQGFVNALSDYGRKSYNAGSDMADYAVNGLSNAISRVSDLINSDIDSQPTIRPVLDLSNITSGAGAINRMLSMQPSMGVMANVGSISTMMNRAQNDPNGAIVSAINELNSKINDVPRNTYVVNGVTYDDGSNVSNAVRSLVRAAKIERRV